MKKIINTTLVSFILLFSIFPCALGNAPIKTDRWLEIDLYWFDKNDMASSVDQLWDRYHPLMEGIEGWRGFILNVGWISDYVLEWHGEINEEIKLPKNMKCYPWFEDAGQLGGKTTERIKLWEERFKMAVPPEVINYEEWTYADLKKLVTLIRKTAKNKYGFMDIKVGTFVLGWENIYGGDNTVFSEKHPGVFKGRLPNWIATLQNDQTKYGAYPQGVKAGTPFTEFFGNQWGSLSQSLGLDVIVLRDSYLGVGIYGRKGPYGKTAPADPAKVKEWSDATANLVRQTKMANPDALVIGYSNAASAVADWRVNCFDLESIAKEGYLDAWIDQTWAGAWNEVGHRPKGFWNAQTLGWTYQLGYMLGHAAVLAETKCKHYFLTETYDAWESWDIIHNASEKLRWGIWAFSHAAVKKPDGLKMPGGSYISWCNKGKELLSKEDVQFLVRESNDAIKDALDTKEIYGPTLVYNRSAMEWQSENAPNIHIGEWIDEQAGSLMKWSVPIQSVTRLEYISDVTSDLFILQTPVHMTEKEKSAVNALFQSGKPVAVFASPVGGIDSEISAIAGFHSKENRLEGIQYIGSTNYQTGEIFTEIPNTFPIFQNYSHNVAGNDCDVIYSVAMSPCLITNNSNGKQMIFWDSPEISNNLNGVEANFGQSLDQLLGSVYPFVLTARLFNETFKKNGQAYFDIIHPFKPLHYSFWRKKDGTFKLLTGNLEEGINHTPDHSVQGYLNFPQKFESNNPREVKDVYSGERVIIGNNRFMINLSQGQVKLYEFR